MTSLNGIKGVSVGLVTALALATALSTAAAPASGAGASSMLCSGYAGCSLGAYTTHGYQNHVDTSYWTMYPGDNCTNYVAYVESTAFGVATPTYDLGDGDAWASAAAAHGVLVNHTPTVGAVASWGSGSSGIGGEGHVAIVEAVGPNDSYIVISQQHMLDATDGYDWTILRPTLSGGQWEQWPDSFIHFAPVPSPNPGFGPVADLAFTLKTNVVFRVLPRRFSRDTFVFSSRLSRIVKPGLVTQLVAGGPTGAYEIAFQRSALRRAYVLHVEVSGSNARVLRQGDPNGDVEPRLSITGRGEVGRPTVVTVVVRRERVRASAVSTTTTSTTTTSTLP
jgi:surface antigen